MMDKEKEVNKNQQTGGGTAAQEQQPQLPQSPDKKNKGPSVFQRLIGANKPVEQETKVNDVVFDMDLQTAKAQNLYRQIKKCHTDEEVKKVVIEELVNHRKHGLKEILEKPSLISNGQKYITDECKEFSLLSPNIHIKK